MNIIENYQNSINALYEHVGFEEGWEIFPINICTNYYWTIDKDKVHFSEDPKYNEEVCTEYIITNIHYPNTIYKGTEYTAILLDTQVDGNVFLSFFWNGKYLNKSDFALEEWN